MFTPVNLVRVLGLSYRFCFLTVFVEFLARRVTAQNWLQQLLIS